MDYLSNNAPEHCNRFVAEHYYQTWTFPLTQPLAPAYIQPMSIVQPLPIRIMPGAPLGSFG